MGLVPTTGTVLVVLCGVILNSSQYRICSYVQCIRAPALIGLPEAMYICIGNRRKTLDVGSHFACRMSSHWRMSVRIWWSQTVHNPHLRCFTAPFHRAPPFDPCASCVRANRKPIAMPRTWRTRTTLYPTGWASLPTQHSQTRQPQPARP